VILLARHGETDDNRPPLRFQGQRDTPLNDTGRAQARALARRLRGEAVASLWSSPLARARETAEIVGTGLGLGAPALDPRLMEGHRGEWEGRVMEDVREAELDVWAAWRTAGARFRFPGGESLAEHQERVLAALSDIARAPSPALVVCHGGSIRCVLCARVPRGLDVFHEWEVPNGAVVWA
jgi:broad specificity phosphatase PhoE